MISKNRISDLVRELAEGALGAEPSESRRDFLELVTADSLQNPLTPAGGRRKAPPVRAIGRAAPISHPDCCRLEEDCRWPSRNASQGREACEIRPYGQPARPLSEAQP